MKKFAAWYCGEFVGFVDSYEEAEELMMNACGWWDGHELVIDDDLEGLESECYEIRFDEDFGEWEGA